MLEDYFTCMLQFFLPYSGRWLVCACTRSLAGLVRSFAAVHFAVIIVEKFRLLYLHSQIVYGFLRINAILLVAIHPF